MKTNDQRDMIEQLLGITEISEKAELLKELLKNTKDNIKEEELRIQAVQNANKRIEKNIDDIELRRKAWDNQHSVKIADLQTSLDELSQTDIEEELDKHRQLDVVHKQYAKMQGLQSELKQLQTSSKRSSSTLVNVRNDIQKAEEGICPACEQSTAHLDTHEAYTLELKAKEKKEVLYSVELEEKVVLLEQDLTDIGELPESPITFYSSMEDALQHRHNLDTITEQLGDRKEETNPYSDQVVSLRETGLEEVSYDSINESTGLKDHQDFLYKLLTSKDSFIRKKIIDQNLQYLNYRLNYYLEKLGLPHDVRFNSDLTVDITEYGRDLDFDNLSRGERNRLILGMSWAFRDIYESLNHPMNLMCVDELVDSGMDTTGVEAALSVLKKMGRESKKNVFLISHKEELQGRVSNVLYVVKEGGFTSYANDIEIVDPDSDVL
jgi:DNA repair exonuclease SbcCD ATPase subunit